MISRLIPVLVALPLVWGLGACGSGSDSTTAPPTEAPPTESSSTVDKSAGGGGQPPSGHAKHRGSDEGTAAGGHHSGTSGGDRKPAGSDGAAVPGENAHFTPPVHHDSGGGVSQFEARGGDNSIQESGQDASGSEFDEGAAALHAYLDARAAGAWAVACEYLSPGVYEQLTDLSSEKSGKGPSCPEFLAGISAGLPPRALREVAVADVGSFRVEGDSGFLLFHGAQGVDWFVPMVREGGAWKVAAIAPSAL